jgi:Na+/proline symporter
MHLHALDWAIILAYAAFALGVGITFARRAGKGMEEYFLSGRRFPWWIVGTSMVATTFAADTPLAITEFIRDFGLWKNWFWWNLALSGLLSAVLFARLWRRARVLTDNELLELRYHGRPAAFLRGFKAIYFALLYNFIVLGWVINGMSSVVAVLLDVDRWDAVWVCVVVAVVYALLSGFWGVVLTDLVQFVIAMVGSIALAIFAVQAVGGLGSLIEQVDEARVERIELLAESAELAGAGPEAAERLERIEARLAELPPVQPHALDIVPPRPDAELFSPDWWSSPFVQILVFLLVMWWAHHGTDGGGYIIQRMSSAKNERHAMLATLWFNVAHYALRVWPWILVGLVSLLLFPSVDGLTDAQGEPLDLGSKAGYALVMRDQLGPGWMGLLVVSFLAAFMSTVDTHLNWGTSYLIHDIYERFVRPRSSFDDYPQAERHYMRVSRVLTVVLMVVAALIATKMQRIDRAWGFVFAMGAGIGLVLILRWFWWRINAWSEIVALATSVTIAITFEVLAYRQLPAGETYELFSRAPVLFGVPFEMHLKLLVIVPISITAWVTATYLTRPEPEATLREFYRRVQPGGWWGRFAGEVETTLEPVTRGFLSAWLSGLALVWGMTFAIGQLILGNVALALVLFLVAAGGLAWSWNRHLSKL